MNPDDLTKKHDNSFDESPLDVKQSSQKRDCEDVPNEDLLLRRKRIRETIEGRIRKQHKDKKCCVIGYERKIKLLAALIEEKMYTNCIGSLCDGSEVSLDSCLENLKEALLKEKQRSSSSPILISRGEDRMEILKHVTGDTTYSRICSVMSMIHRIRIMNSGCNGTFCRKMKTENKDDLPVSLKSNEKAPEVVTRLFLQTELVSAIERYPVEQFTLLPWESLLEKAITNVNDYKEWVAKEQPAMEFAS